MRKSGPALLLIGLAAGLAAWGCRSTAKPELLKRLAALPKNAALGEPRRAALRADLGDGPRELELYHVHAPAQRPDPGRLPVVLVHGTPSTLYTWAPLILGGSEPDLTGLAADRDVYAIEVIGHGFAPGDEAPYGFDRCARFVAASLEALGLEAAHLVGSSYGGEFAWRAALDSPERIASLTVIDSSGIERREGDWLSEEVQMRENGLAGIGWLLNSRSRIESALAPHFDGIPPDRVEEFFLVCGNAHNWGTMVDLARDENGSREGELGEIEQPTLVLWGARDVAYEADYYARRFADAIEGARLVTVPDAGHYPHEERPRAVASALSAFFDEVEGAR